MLLPQWSVFSCTFSVAGHGNKPVGSMPGAGSWAEAEGAVLVQLPCGCGGLTLATAALTVRLCCWGNDGSMSFFCVEQGWSKELCPAMSQKRCSQSSRQKKREKPERKGGPQKARLEEIVMNLTSLEKQHWKKGMDWVSSCKRPRNNDSQEKFCLWEDWIAE